MKAAADEHRHFYVDETGDPNFYAKGRKLIVGEEGCSRTFGVGFVRTAQPEPIRQALAELRSELAKDSYLAKIPSMQKTLTAFHAKDDCPKVRKAVFETLRKQDLAAHIVIARKSERIFINRHHSSQDVFYEALTSHLFERQLHLAQENTIVFARRGNKTKQHALRSAVNAGVAAFRSKYPAADQTSVDVQTAFASEDGLLQASDYLLWAVFRAIERRDMRYFDFMAEKFELVWDIYDFTAQAARGSSVYTRKDPLNLDKVSPLS